LRAGDKTGADNSRLLQDLVEKIENRKEEIANQIDEDEDEDEEEDNFDFDDAATVNNLKD
jgi:hypothetical protein